MTSEMNTNQHQAEIPPTALPVEIWHHALSFVDFQSHVNFSLVSRHAKALVEGIRSYVQLRDHARHVLVVLKDTGLLSKHTPEILFETLQSTVCASCEGHGIHIFLPTCQRACEECLCDDRSFWVLPPTLALDLFELSAAQIASIPRMLNVPRIPDAGRLRLITYRDVKEVVLQPHDSNEDPVEAEGEDDGWVTFGTESLMDPFDQQERDLYLALPGDDHLNLGRDIRPSTLFPDGFAGMASIVVPPLEESGIEWFASSTSHSHLYVAGVFEGDDQDLYWGRAGVAVTE